MISKKELIRLNREYRKAGEDFVETQKKALLQRWEKHKNAFKVEAKTVFGSKANLEAEVLYDPECYGCTLEIVVFCTDPPEIEDWYDNDFYTAVKNVFKTHVLYANIKYREIQ